MSNARSGAANMDIDRTERDHAIPKTLMVLACDPLR